MGIAFDSRFGRLAGKALLYLAGAVLLGLAAKRLLPEETSRTLVYVFAIATLLGFEEGFRRGRLRADGGNSQTREYFWWSFAVAVCAATILLA